MNGPVGRLEVHLVSRRVPDAAELGELCRRSRTTASRATRRTGCASRRARTGCTAGPSAPGSGRAHRTPRRRREGRRAIAVRAAAGPVAGGVVEARHDDRDPSPQGSPSSSTRRIASGTGFEFVTYAPARLGAGGLAPRREPDALHRQPPFASGVRDDEHRQLEVQAAGVGGFASARAMIRSNAPRDLRHGHLDLRPLAERDDARIREEPRLDRAARRAVEAGRERLRRRRGCRSPSARAAAARAAGVRDERREPDGLARGRRPRRGSPPPARGPRGCGDPRRDTGARSPVSQAGDARASEASVARRRIGVTTPRAGRTRGGRGWRGSRRSASSRSSGTGTRRSHGS